MKMVKKFGLPLISLLLLVGCSTIKYVPIKGETKIVYRDSVVTRVDTLEIPVEKVVLKEVLPALDTSYLSVELASSTAFLDTNTRQLHHTLIQKDTVLKPKVEIKEVIKMEEKIIEKEVPIEVVKEKKVVPSWCWWLLSLNIVGLIAILIFILVKKKF